MSRRMNEATIYMTDGNEYVVDYVTYENDYTTITLVSEDGTISMVSKFNMNCIVLKGQNENI